MDQDNPHHIDRRGFVKIVTAGVGAVIGAMVGIPVIGYLLAPALRKQETESWIPLAPLDQIPIGIPTFFSFTRQEVNGWEKNAASYGVFAVRKDAESILVLSNICTHLACHVAWHPDQQNYISPCHNGHFDIVGNVISGPPPRPLDAFKTKVENGQLFILYPPYKRS